jgi:hypothetical protein
MNPIPLIPFDKPEWRVVKEKHVRYKIVNYKKYYQRSPGTPRNGKTIFVYDFGDGLNVIRMSYSASKGATGVEFARQGADTFRLRVRNGRLVIWKTQLTPDRGRIVRNVSNRIDDLKRILLNFGNKNTYSKPFQKPEPKPKQEQSDEIPLSHRISELMDSSSDWPEVTKTQVRVIKSVNARLNKILIHFLKRHGIKFKYGRDFFENLRVACYPFTEGFALKSNSLNAVYSRHFIHGDIKHVVKKCFGTDGGKLTRMVCERIRKDQNFDVLCLGAVIKGLMPVDYVYQALEKANVTKIKDVDKNRVGVKLNVVRALLKNYNASRVLKLVLDENFGEWYFNDSIIIYGQRKAEPDFQIIEKPKSWQEIHDYLAPRRLAASVKTEEMELPVSPKYKEIDGLEYEGFKIEVPKHTNDLVSYANQMQNCIRWYGSQVVAKQCNILGIYKEDKLVYNISIRSKVIDQFRGKCNSEPDPEDKSKILKALLEKGIISSLPDDRRDSLALARAVIAPPVPVPLVVANDDGGVPF